MAKVLIIEDNQQVAEIERLALEEHSHQVQVAGDGPSGVLAARRMQPDVIVLDVALPLFDGNAVLFGLDLNPSLRQVAVVVVTGNVAQLEAAQRQRVAAILQKPFDIDAFLQAVEQAAEALFHNGQAK
jgi:CheY-like chemotaxis protein